MIIDNGTTSIEFKVRSFKPLIKFGYKVIPLSNKGAYSVLDRGHQSDSYSTELTLESSTDYINDIINFLIDIRGNDVVLKKVDEPLFGDHIKTDFDHHCLVKDITIVESTKLNTKEFKITLILKNPSFITTSTIPTMRALYSSYKTGGKWNTHVNNTYHMDYYFIDKEKDKKEFVGTYALSSIDNGLLLNYVRSNRGTTFTIDEADWGITKMFGPDTTETNHDVKIASISYEYIGPVLRYTTINLVKVY